MTTISAEKIEVAAKAILIACGAHAVVAQDVARALVVTSLRGIDSHGIGLLPRIVARAEAGRCRLDRPAGIAMDSGEKAVTVLDAELAPGQHAALAAARLAAQKARQFGIGYVAVRNSTHFGACTPYILEIVDAGMVGMVGSNSTMSMAAFDAPFVNLGNNPIGFGAPVADSAPLVFDFSCGVMSFGRLKTLRAEGKEPPPGAFITPTVRPGGDPVYEIAGSLTDAALPFGGYKGASIALMVDVLAGVLGGGNFGARTETMDKDRFLGPSHFALAIDPEGPLGSAHALTARMEDLVHDVTGSDSALRLPGSRGKACESSRRRDGIPISSAFAGEISNLCVRTGVELPFDLREQVREY